MTPSLYSILYGLSSVLGVGVLALLPLACGGGSGDRDSVVMGDHYATVLQVDTKLSGSPLLQSVVERVNAPAQPDAQSLPPEHHLTSPASPRDLTCEPPAMPSPSNAGAPSREPEAGSAASLRPQPGCSDASSPQSACPST